MYHKKVGREEKIMFKRINFKFSEDNLLILRIRNGGNINV